MGVKLKVASRASVKVKVIPTFPASISGEDGITVERTAGAYVIGIDAIPAANISFAPTAGISATNVQTAIQELDTEKQPLDSDLTALAANSTNGLWARTGSGAGSARTITGTSNEITVSNGDGVSGNPTLSLPSTLTLTGKTVTADTQTAGDSSTKLATTAFVTGAIREKLTAARTYYVRTDGSDSNTGLANTSGGAFLTIGKALTVCGGLDLGVYNATIQVGSGTFSANLTVSSPWTGSGSVLLYGDNTTPSNCVIGTVTVNTGARLKIRGFRTPLISAAGGFINIVGKMDYTSGQAFHLSATVGGIINSEFITYNISAATSYAHVLANSGGIVLLNSCTVTTTGTLNFTGYFSFASRGGIIDQSSNDFTGVSLTGTGKYTIDTGGIIYAGGGTLPGSGTNGGTTTGGGFYT